MSFALPPLLIALLIGSLIAGGAIRLLMPHAARWRLLDRPRGRKRHRVSVPMVGGPALFVAWLAGTAWSRGALPPATLPVTLLFAVGLLDDLGGKTMRASTKAVATFVILVGARLLLGAEASWASLLPAFLVLHSFNTSDNMNGLAGGLALVGVGSLLGAVALGLAPGVDPYSSAALGGGLLAFLACNFPRARVFLGDSGSLLLGGWFACTFLEQSHPAFLLLGARPLADLVTVAFLRWRAGARPWIGDCRHVSHRLALGLGEVRAVALLILAQLVWAVSTLFLLSLTPVSPSQSWLFTGLALCVACGGTLAVRDASLTRR